MTRYRVSTEELRARLASLDATWRQYCEQCTTAYTALTWHQRQGRRRALRDYKRRRASLVRRIRTREAIAN
jgi:multidrug resistance efflux pump